MKMFLIILFVVSAHFTLRAETFIGTTSATNRWIVATNEVVIIQKIQVESNREFQLIKDGITHTFSSGTQSPPGIPSPINPCAIAGPCELVFTNNSYISFQRITASGIQTFITTTNTITVTLNAGQTLKLFRPLYYVDNFAGGIQLRRGTNTFAIQQLYAICSNANEEFGGPLELTFLGYGLPTLYSYVLVEQAQTVPQGVTVQSPTGSFQLMVEKSGNLTNWNPAILQSLTDEQKAFYRLRIQK